MVRSEREHFFLLASQYTSLVAVRGEGATYVVPTRRDVVGRSLFANGTRAHTAKLARAVHSLSELMGGDATGGRTFVDVGAGFGMSTVTALTSHGFAAAVACEPEAENCRLLGVNLALNDLGARARIVPAAISDEVGDAQLLVTPGNSGGHKVVSDDVAPRPDGGDGVATVEKLTLDELVARDVIDPARVGLVWIDAQGHEGHVLAGADELLDRGVPVVARFQPRLLAEAGGLELFTRQITRHFTSFVALGAVSGRHQDAQPRGVRDLINIAENFDTDERSARLGAILAFRAPKAVRPHPAAVRPHPVAAPQASSGLKKLSEPAAARKPGARKKRSSVGTAPTPGGREKRPSPVAKPS